VKALRQYDSLADVERNRTVRQRLPRQVSAAHSSVLVAMTAVLMLGAAPAKVQTSAPASETAKTGNAEEGKRLYIKYGCYECHGLAGQGSTTSGPRIGPDPVPLPALVLYLRNPTGQMPPYTEKVVSNQELADIHAFLESLPHPREARTIPLLNE
jgi:ubiquinol-cytochrome c reductase cytochrome c subunit